MSGIHIKAKNKGKFTAAAKSHGMGVQAFAHHVLANPSFYSGTLRKRANFARNASKWKHEDGGEVYEYGGKIYGNGGEVGSLIGTGVGLTAGLAIPGAQPFTGALMSAGGTLGGFIGKSTDSQDDTNMNNQYVTPTTSYKPYGAKYANGGSVQHPVINVERKELEVKDGQVIRDFLNKPPHPTDGSINPEGNIQSQEGNIIIPAHKRNDYLNKGVEERKSIEKELVAQQKERQATTAKFAEGGKIPKKLSFTPDNNNISPDDLSNYAAKTINEDEIQMQLNPDGKWQRILLNPSAQEPDYNKIINPEDNKSYNSSFNNSLLNKEKLNKNDDLFQDNNGLYNADSLAGMTYANRSNSKIPYNTNYSGATQDRTIAKVSMPANKVQFAQPTLNPKTIPNITPVKETLPGVIQNPLDVYDPDKLKENALYNAQPVDSQPTNSMQTKDGSGVDVINQVGTLAPYLDNVVNYALTKNTPNIPKPIKYSNYKLDDNINVEPILSDINSQKNDTLGRIAERTNSGSVYRSNAIVANQKAQDQRNAVMMDKNNRVNQIHNQEILGNQEINQNNINMDNAYNHQNMVRSDDIAKRYSDNAANLTQDLQGQLKDKRLYDNDAVRTAMIYKVYNTDGVLDRAKLQGLLSSNIPDRDKALLQKLLA